MEAVYVSLKDIDKKEGFEIIKEYYELGFKIYASEGTGMFLNKKEFAVF